MGRVVFAIAVMAAVALFSRAFVAVGKAPPDWKVAVDSLVGIVSVVTAVITYRALGLAEVSANAARTAAELARESAESLKRAERGYLRFSFDPPDWSENNNAQLILFGENVGKTPITVTKLNWILRSEGEEEFPDVAKFIQNGGVSAVFPIGPSARKLMNHRVVLRGRRYQILIAAEYIDIFSQTWRSVSARLVDVDVMRGSFIGPVEWNTYE